MEPGDEKAVLQGCGKQNTASTDMPESMSSLLSPFPERQVKSQELYS